MSTPTLPDGLIWGLFTHNETGRLHLVNRDGERFGFDPSEVPHLAAMLADHCRDNDERAFVRTAWEDADPEDWDDD